MDDDICVSCYAEHNRIVHNVNGRCDFCGGLTFLPQTVIEQEYNIVRGQE